MSATILVVEDEVDLLFTIALSLELNGYRVVKAASGEEALTIVDEERPDAMVLDIRLPGIDGWEVIDRLRRWATSRPPGETVQPGGAERRSARPAGLSVQPREAPAASATGAS